MIVKKEPLNEFDQILIPGDGGAYESHTLTHLARNMWRSSSGLGLAPLHFLEQRGPFQDGSSALGMRYDTRTIQIVIGERQACRTEYWDKRWDVLDLLRPNRAFGMDGIVRPHVYRKWLPNGKAEQGTDLVTVTGSDEVTSHDGRFVHWGLEIGATFEITDGADAAASPYTVVSVPNDYTVQLDANMGADATDVGWRYTRGWGKRDLYCLLEQGPSYDEGPLGTPYYPTGFREALRFVAHDPFWYGLEQSESWALPADIGDLVFDGAGAWFGEIAGTGRWLFATTYIGETASIVYWGTRFAKPTIEIDGPAEDPSVSNTTIDTTLRMSYTVAAGETVTINTLNQTVVNNAGTNLMPYLTGDLAGFGLYPDPQATNRQNEVNVSFGGAVAGQSAARLAWKNRYVGV